MDEEVSKKILPILRKIVVTKEGTANLANVEGYEIEEKQAQQTKVQTEIIQKKINTLYQFFLQVNQNSY